MATQARQRRSAPQAPPAGSAQSAGSAQTAAVESDAVQNASADRDGQLRELYRDMVLVRRFEERAARAYTEALVGGYCHLNLGEEAAVVGLMAALNPTDYLFTNYREHGYALMRGIDPKNGYGRAVRSRRRRLQGLGRLDAHVRRHAPAARRVRHRRRPAAAGDRRGARHRLPGRRRGRDVHPRRRHHRYRGLPRVAEHRRPVEPADRVRDHQQRARHGHDGREVVRRARPVQARCRVPDGVGAR